MNVRFVMALEPLQLTLDELADRALAYVRNTPQTLAAITAHLNESFAERLTDSLTIDFVEDLTEDINEVHHLQDERLIDEMSLWEGAILTHRLTEEEIAEGEISLVPDFDHLLSLAMSRRVSGELSDYPIVAGTTGWGCVDDLERKSDPAGTPGPVSVDGRRTPWTSPDRLLGEPGWLSGFSSGTLVGVRIGRAHDEWIGDVDPSSFNVEAASEFEAVFRSALASLDDLPVELGDVLWADVSELLVRYLGVSTLVLPPTLDILNAIGASTNGSFIANAEFDWDAWEDALAQRRLAHALGASPETLAKLPVLFVLAGKLGESGADGLVPEDLSVCRETVRDAAVRKLLVSLSVEDHPSDELDELDELDEFDGFGDHDDFEEIGDSDSDSDDLDGSPRMRALDFLLGTACTGASRRDQATIGLLRAQMARAADPRFEDPATATFITAQLDQALSADPRNLDVIDDMAWEALRRNDLSAVRAHIRNWGANGGVDRAKLERGEELGVGVYLRMNVDGATGVASVVRASTVGRNDPCICGSGRKFKQCCINKPAVSNVALSTRAPLLHASLCWFVSRNFPDDAASLHTAMSRAGDSVDAFVAAVDAVGARPEVIEAFESQMTPAFLGPGERALIGCWSVTGPGLFEVVARVPGQSLSIRDVRTGDQRRVRSDSMSRTLDVGQYVLARPLPTDVDPDGTVPDRAEWKLYSGCIEIPFQLRDPLLKLLDEYPLAEDVYRWVHDPSDTQQLPQLRNTDGEELTFSVRRWSVDDGEVATTALDTLVAEFDPDGADDADDADGSDGADGDDADGREGLAPPAVLPATQRISLDRVVLTRSSEPGDDPSVWTILDVRPHNRLVVGAIRSSGNEIELEANSTTRIEALTPWLCEHLGLGAPAIVHDETFEDRMYLRNLGFDGNDSDDDLGDDDEFGEFGEFDEFDDESDEPQLSEEAMSQVRRQLEDRWLSESVPALGGLTPRQAAVDPSRRDDLRRLLDSFERQSTGNWFSYDVHRLRRELNV